jgi:alpha-galactosidase
VVQQMITPLLGLLIAAGSPAAAAEATSQPLAPTPPMGWNSFDSYRVEIHEKACFDNLKTFVDVFKPVGYEYFIIDAGWYYEFKLRPGTMIPVIGDEKVIDENLNEFGYLIPSKTFYPNGLKPLADECHKNGVKFGVHIMRGIPRKAVKLNTPIKGTSYTATDIANTKDICEWCPLNYGIDMTKPGSQEYYDGFIQQLADYGVDFIKADDIVEFPAEIEAVLKAIKKTSRPIVLSLSPGDRVLGNEIATYEKADMLRVTGDVWDRQFDIDKCFDSWLTWQYVPAREGFWYDMDMIPFGELNVTVPADTSDDLAGNEGKHRFDQFTVPQKKTFITMRAMSASPLFIGGVLPTMDKESLRLLTSKEMIACNQNGKMGHMIGNKRYVQTWLTEKRGTDKKSESFSLRSLGLDPKCSYDLYDIWSDKPIKPGKIELEPHDCVFMRYSLQEK